jgi:MFS family permease
MAEPGRTPERDGGIETRASWLVALAAVAILSVAFGAPLIVVVALKPIAADLGAERAVPALASSLTFLGAGAGGIAMGWLSGRVGMRAVAILGALMVAGGLVLASGGMAWQLLVGYGLFVGLLGNAALFPPMMAYVSRWFDRRRGSAIAFVASGQYVAGALWPVLFEMAVARWGWQATMRGFAVIVVLAVLPLAAMVLRPPPVPPPSAGTAREAAVGAPVLGMPPNLAMALMSAGIFMCCVPMAMPAAHLVAFCTDLGIAAQRGAMMLSVLLVAAFVARQAWGLVADRIGGLHAVLAGNLAQVIGMALFLATQDEAGLFLVAAIYGMGFSGIIPSWMLAVRQLFPAQEAAWRMPTVLFSGLTGMAFGAWFAGFLYDRFGNYAVAWQVGIAVNVMQVALVVALVWRDRRLGRADPAMA